MKSAILILSALALCACATNSKNTPKPDLPPVVKSEKRDPAYPYLLALIPLLYPALDAIYHRTHGEDFLNITAPGSSFDSRTWTPADREIIKQDHTGAIGYREALTP